MKYKAKQLNGGEWAVFKRGNTYWPHTVSDTEEEAHLWALKLSAIWHRNQLDKLSDEFGLVEGSSLSEWIC
jgi:hypothetical protein